MKRNTSLFFGKNLAEITLEDLRDYFSTRQEESSKLEFKSGEVEITDVFKEIAAFLNTEGGLLIIGAPRELKETEGKRTIRYCQGDLTFSKFVSKDWLQQKIFSNITPSPTDIAVKEINTTEGSVFIIDIPQSFTPPHQSNSDGRYYIRIDNEAKPAPHGLIQALFEKRKKPKLTARLNKQTNDALNDSITIYIQNESSIPADKVSFIIDVYNVNSVDSDHLFHKIDDDGLGIKFTLSENSRQILASVIVLQIKLTVEHVGKNYIITVNYWCKDTDFDCKYFIIDPNNDNIESHHWLDEGARLTDRIDDLHK
ncbi:ATP-binding protein [Lacibacter sp.]|uniref:AlbA family DNA-binding domain-containing protein n=1 Tax=Lacibacter sp. TaxID=1915409 RepID=UPI002B4B5E08|nr:ATP-binding protein [Lacibacter sp.]HLP35534.1 ATP-binding protein [Lacibacter sp.]